MVKKILWPWLEDKIGKNINKKVGHGNPSIQSGLLQVFQLNS